MNEATQIVHWPGESLLACDRHAEQLKRMGSAMGFVVNSTPVDAGVCGNCVNEAHKKESAHD